MAYDETKVQFTDVSTSQYIYGEEWDDNHKNDYIVDNDLTTVWEGAHNAYATVKFATPILLSKVDVTVTAGDAVMQNINVVAVDGANETALWSSGSFYVGEGEVITKSKEFSNTTVKEIQVKFSNNGWWHGWINEIRVYGTVPGAVNYTPALILMQ